MNANLEWLTKEEGLITFSEDNSVWGTARFYVTGPEDAEFQLQDVVFPEKWTEDADICKEIIHKTTKIIRKAFLLMWKEGYEEAVLMEPKGTKLAEILDSTDVVQKVYSEYMMCRYFEKEKSTDSGGLFLRVMQEEDGYVCENEERTFFCRLLPYEAKTTGENCFYVYEVEVNRKKRNQGIATTCLTKLFRQFACEAPMTVYLQVGSYNEPAVHLYKKLGFEISEELCYFALKE